MPEPMDEFLNAEELAAWFQMTKATLYHWRYRGIGPRSVKIGRHLRYRRSDVEAWLEEQSTSGDA